MAWERLPYTVIVVHIVFQQYLMGSNFEGLTSLRKFILNPVVLLVLGWPLFR